MRISKQDLDYGMFAGDGRFKVMPIRALSNTSPTSIMKTTARRIITNFVSTGVSQHSARGSTLWVILYFCQLNEIEYTLLAKPGDGGYVVKASDFSSHKAVHCHACQEIIAGYNYHGDEDEIKDSAPLILCNNCAQTGGL